MGNSDSLTKAMFVLSKQLHPWRPGMLMLEWQTVGLSASLNMQNNLARRIEEIEATASVKDARVMYSIRFLGVSRFKGV